MIGCASAAHAGEIAAFSRAAAGSDPPGPWRAFVLRSTKAPRFSLVEDAGRIVLRARAEAAAGSLTHELSAEPAATPMLAWSWKVERALERAAWGRREGDDFAARVYVFFDVPLDSLPIGARAGVRLARMIHGEAVPTAALCYVWANDAPVGATAWNPYSDRVRMVVLDSGNQRAGQWVAHRRDVEADFRAAFGAQWRGATPRITGIAASVDTDQTGEAATAWFGDFRLEPRP